MELKLTTAPTEVLVAALAVAAGGSLSTPPARANLHTPIMTEAPFISHALFWRAIRMGLAAQAAALAVAVAQPKLLVPEKLFRSTQTFGYSQTVMAPLPQ
jgi:hypothetical protein